MKTTSIAVSIEVEQMTQCACMSPNCERGQHGGELQCKQEATLKIVSRDWGEHTIEMCRTCGLDALVSGIFERPERAS